MHPISSCWMATPCAMAAAGVSHARKAAPQRRKGLVFKGASAKMIRIDLRATYAYRRASSTSRGRSGLGVDLEGEGDPLAGPSLQAEGGGIAGQRGHRARHHPERPRPELGLSAEVEPPDAGARRAHEHRLDAVRARPPLDGDGGEPG